MPVVDRSSIMAVRATLAGAGCIAPDEEAAAILEAVAEGVGPLDALLARRVQGEPLPWITGWTSFCGLRVRVVPGVFVPRPHTQALARRAADLLPAGGTAVDLCTGCGAIAMVVRNADLTAHVFDTDTDPVAVACARSNGVDAVIGDLHEGLPASLVGRTDVVTAVVPYVPTPEIRLLPRDVQAYEPRVALDGGPDGTMILVRAVAAAERLLRPSGSVLLELGGEQAAPVTVALRAHGFTQVRVHADPEVDDMLIEARWT
jgi:release factor glutamine methyltransferase